MDPRSLRDELRPRRSAPVGTVPERPVGPIHFASSDIAAEGYQHVDGAVRIGTATAERILGEKS